MHRNIEEEHSNTLVEDPKIDLLQTGANGVKRRSDMTRRKSRIIGALLRWYRKNGRPLSWRYEKDPYRILVSEVMLQQTQVARVSTKYPEFLKKFPTLDRLARARTSDVIRIWRGLGYNNRALRLQKLSKIVVQDFGGKLPENIEDLQSLPGIGRYTAHAVACFAFGQRVPVVDTNINRVLGRLSPQRRKLPTLQATEMWALAEYHLPRTNTHNWNQALMDLGAAICIAAIPRCELCPLKRLCPSAHMKRQRAARAPRREPGRHGIPNRIYRGKAIEVLRDLKPGRSITSSSLARRIMPEYTERDRRWYLLLLQNLERDGLMKLRGRTRISLPD
ncbi:MAG: A/G-specific adenine glycosylase [Ignavibacteria bacterium]|nr:A/G-specific adenine glycosylase [Ignavibacteria bacterium]